MDTIRTLPSGNKASACIGLGSNLGDSLTLVYQAWEELGRHPNIEPIALSPPFRSEPVGMASSNWFVNAAALIRCNLDPASLLAVLQNIEHRFGRRRDPALKGYQDRTLDLDLLLYDQLIREEADPILPHPAMHERLFVLEPLALIAPDFIHPVLGLSVMELRNDLWKKENQPPLEKLNWPVGRR